MRWKILLLILVVVAGASRAAEKTFVFGKHGLKHNVITVESQTDLESMVTTTSVISGQMLWDPDAKTGNAKLSVPVTSLSTGIKQRDEHLQSKAWLDAETNPDIVFETTSVKAKSATEYEVQGSFTIKGVKKPISTVATLRYIPYTEAFEKLHMPKGNLVKIMASFDLKLSDFDVKSPAIPATVSDTLHIKLNLTGVNEL
ncbi:MAG TPA: YceI family protein [Planctomycetota bacterium]|jgi:polyisoprenoid-binding protein YceI